MGIDTATSLCGVAIAEEGSLLCDYRILSGSLHTDFLLPMIDRALTETKLSLSDLDGISMSTGPGSFTGLRVGVSTVKGLLTGFPKPIAAVSTLQAMAWTVAFPGSTICPWLDAKKGEIYAALFSLEVSGDMKRLIEDRVMTPQAVLEQLSGPVVFVGDGAERYREAISARLGRDAVCISPIQNRSVASALAERGAEQIRQAQTIDIHQLQPVYLRRSDAEVNREKKLSEK